MRGGNVRGQRLLLRKLAQASCRRTLVLECATVLGGYVHMHSTLVSLRILTVRALERAICEADIFVRHFDLRGGGQATLAGGGFNF